MSQSELVGAWASRSHGDLDAAHGDPNLGTDLEELQADRSTGCLGKDGVRQAEPSKSADQNICK